MTPPGVPPVGYYALPEFLAHPDFTLQDAASQVLGALLHDSGRENDEGSQLAAADAELRANHAGFVRENKVYVFAKGGLEAAKAAAMRRGTASSASEEQFEAALVHAGWAEYSPAPAKNSAVVNGRRRKVWPIPAYVRTHAGPSTPNPLEPDEALRSLVDSIGLKYTARLAGVSVSSVKNWLYADVPITWARQERIVVAAMLTGLLTASGALNPLYWLFQPSPALQTFYWIPAVPCDALEHGVSRKILLAAAQRSVAALI